MSVLDLEVDIKPYLSIEQNADNTRLQATLDAAEAMVATDIILDPTEVSVRLYGCKPTLTVPTLPVISLTSVTDSAGGVVDTSLLDLDVSGVLRFISPYMAFWAPSYTVVYQAGFTTVPADLKRGIAALVQHLWRAQRGPGRANSSQAPDGPGTYAMARQIIEPYIPLAGV